MNTTQTHVYHSHSPYSMNEYNTNTTNEYNTNTHIPFALSFTQMNTTHRPLPNILPITSPIIPSFHHPHTRAYTCSHILAQCIFKPTCLMYYHKVITRVHLNPTRTSNKSNKKRIISIIDLRPLGFHLS